MPLPKPPARKAAHLAPADFEAQAAPKTAPRSSKSTDRAEPDAGVLDLFDGAAAVAAPPLPLPIPRSSAPLRTPVAQVRPRKPRGTGPAKLFVLDTNVLMHDPTCLFRFEEHDIFLPMITLEELDGHKKGMSEVARNVRQVSRELDAMAAQGFADPKEGIPLSKTGKRAAKTSAAAEPASPAELSLFDPAPQTLPQPATAAAPQPVSATAADAPRRPVADPRPRRPRGTGPAKLFVLDTNVLMHDPTRDRKSVV